jgi:DNA-binding CsgD family transcriptional regulator
MIHESDDPAAALLYEQEGLTRERLVGMLRAEGFRSCAVDDPELFHQLRRRTVFARFVVGVTSLAELEALALELEPRPLLLVAPLAEKAQAAAFRVALSDVDRVDRALRDPDAMREWLRGPGAVPRDASPPDLVRAAFEPAGLSERQLEVLTCALRGESGAAIARRLFISEPTVRNHLHAIYGRLRVSGRRELQGRFVQALLEGGVAE